MLKADTMVRFAHLLPPVARTLADLIGLPETLRLIEVYGGQVFQVPKGKRRRGEALIEELAEAIGIDAARRLAATWGGEYLRVPVCRDAIRAIRDDALQARYNALCKEGLSARRIENRLAREFSCTVITVQRASTRSTAPDPEAVSGGTQGSLFP